MELLSATNPKSIFLVSNQDLYTDKYCYYVHEFLTDEHIYGSFYIFDQEMTIDDLLNRHEDEFISTFCPELAFDEDHTNIIYDPDCCGDPSFDCDQTYVVSFKLIRQGELPPINYVSFFKSELDPLIDQNITFYCDYMDQGFDIIEDDYSKYPDRKSFLKDVLWGSEYSEMVEYCAGETPCVNLNDLNQALNTSDTFMQRINNMEKLVLVSNSVVN